MFVSRRTFIEATTGVAAASVLLPISAGAAQPAAFKAILFDAFPIFDPRPVFTLVETLFPGKGEQLSLAWRTRQFEYMWLRSMSNNYADFSHATDDALVFSAKMLKLDLSAAARKQLKEAYFELKVYPDVLPALQTLQAKGLKLAFLSNMSRDMLDANMKNAKLQGMFEKVLSTDAVRAYKPDPRAYAMGLDAFKLRRDEMLFVPFAGWDAAGAKAFGYPTFWVDRLHLPAEELGVQPDGSGAGLQDLVSFIDSGARTPT